MCDQKDKRVISSAELFFLLKRPQSIKSRKRSQNISIQWILYFVWDSYSIFGAKDNVIV